MGMDQGWDGMVKDGQGWSRMVTANSEFKLFSNLESPLPGAAIPVECNGIHGIANFQSGLAFSTSY